MKQRKLMIWKVLGTWILFLLLHFSYERFPNILFQIIGEEGETSYFHMKMLFFAYIFTTLGEYFIRRKELSNPISFMYARMFIAVVFPWMTISMWYSAQALGFVITNITLEIIYANIVTLIGIYFAIRADEAFENIEYRPSLRNLILLFFATALLGYVSFSFNTPEHFFTAPNGEIYGH